jgi:hypothetical protein
MKNLSLLLLAASLLVVIGCKDNNDNPVASNTETTVRFTTATSVKIAPVYFSFDTGGIVDSTGTWDLKLTYTLMVVDTSIPAIKYPFIALNQLRTVQAKIVDGMEFPNVNGSTTSGLASDNGSTAIIGVNCLNYDSNTHLLNPFANRTFVVKTGSNARTKFKMISYYNDALVSGYMTFDYVKY